MDVQTMEPTGREKVHSVKGGGAVAETRGEKVKIKKIKIKKN